VEPGADGGGGLSLTALSVQYFFRVPDEDAFVVLTFSSPTIGAHLRLQAEWHDIASNFRFEGTPLYVDDATEDVPLDVEADADGAGNGAGPV
jgi:hypothetical protein